MTSSILSTVLYGVAYRGSVLGPILFVLYTTALLQLVRDDGLLPHAYADVTQILGIGHPLEADRLQNVWTPCHHGWLLIGCSLTRKLEHSPGGVLETGPLLLQDHKSGTVCRPISDHVRSLSYGQFRRLLKTFLFRQ